MSADSDAVVARLRLAGSVFAEDEAALLREAAGDDPAALDALVDRRAAGEAIEHLVGWVAFDGMRLAVAPGVFVPRQRSRRIATAAARLAAESAAGGRDPVVVELCCGVAPIAAAVARRVPTARVHVADVDAAAVAVAVANLPPTATAHVGPGFAALPSALRGHIDVAAAVAPYVPDGASDLLPHGTLDQEPPSALLGGTDGLDVVRVLLAEASDWLAPGGRLLLELGRGQRAPAAAAARSAGLLVRRRAVAADGQTALLDVARGRGPDW